MRRPRTNYAAISLCVVLQMALGALWYSPALFSDAWLGFLGKSLEDIGQPSPAIYLLPLAAAFLQCWVLAFLINRSDYRNAVTGMQWAAVLWAAVILPYAMTHNTFSGLSVGVTVLDTGKELVGLLLSGSIIGAWRPRLERMAPPEATWI